MPTALGLPRRGPARITGRNSQLRLHPQQAPQGQYAVTSIVATRSGGLRDAFGTLAHETSNNSHPARRPAVHPGENPRLPDFMPFTLLKQRGKSKPPVPFRALEKRGVALNPMRRAGYLSPHFAYKQRGR